MTTHFLSPALLCLGWFLCSGSGQPDGYTADRQPSIRLVVLDPAHPHGVHIQQSRKESFHPQVAVYAPSKADMQANYLDQIEKYNRTAPTQTPWQLELYTGPDFLDKMLQEKKGSMVLIASNNGRKADYIEKSASAGFSVIADKPMALNGTDFKKLENAFRQADNHGIFISDLASMSMRRYITCILLKELVATADVFGQLQSGSPGRPAVLQMNHHFYSKGIVRPAWFFDVQQQGNGLTDVTTHLIDQAQWACFPGMGIDYVNDIRLGSARVWPARISREQFRKVTRLSRFPDFLEPYLRQDTLYVDANGEINYTLKGVHVRIVSTWGFEAVSGGDTYESIVRGTKATLMIRAGNQNDLFIVPRDTVSTEALEKALVVRVEQLKQHYPTLSLTRDGAGWRISSKEKLIGRDDYTVPPSAWEKRHMLAKYYTTTQAHQMMEQGRR